MFEKYFWQSYCSIFGLINKIQFTMKKAFLILTVALFSASVVLAQTAPPAKPAPAEKKHHGHHHHGHKKEEGGNKK